MMQLSLETVNTLKNFSQINPSLVVEPGSEIVTMSPSKTIIARMITEEMFDKPFCIYELSKFLGIVSMLEDADYQFQENYVDIKSKIGNVKYTYADKSMVVAPLTNKIDVTEPIASFQLNKTELTSLIKAASILQNDLVTISCIDGKLKVGTSDSKDQTAHSFGVDVQTEVTNDFSVMVKTENIVKILPNHYDVTINNKVIQFKNDVHTYWIVIEQK